MSACWVLLAGLIRDSAVAHEQAAQIRRLKDRGLVEGIVFSTWRGEFAKHPDVLERYKALGAVVVEGPQPNLRLPGHVLHQSIAILNGLSHIPDGKKVLKIRPDIAPLNSLIDEVLSQDWLEEPLNDVAATGYAKRIWTHSGLIMWPFYLNDILFYGDKADLFDLCDIDVKHEWLFSELAPEQFFHLGRLTRINPVLQAFARVQRGMHAPEHNARLGDILWQTDLWYDVLHETARELVANYYVGFTPPAAVHAEDNIRAFSAISLKDLLSAQVAAPQFECRTGAGGNVFHSTAWAHALLQGHFRHDDVWRRYEDRGAIDLDVKVEAFAATVSSHFPDYRPKLPHPDANVTARIDDVPARIMLLDQRDVVAELTSEINILRRKIDSRPDNK